MHVLKNILHCVVGEMNGRTKNVLRKIWSCYDASIDVCNKSIIPAYLVLRPVNMENDDLWS